MLANKLTLKESFQSSREASSIRVTGSSVPALRMRPSNLLCDAIISCTACSAASGWVMSQGIKWTGRDVKEGVLVLESATTVVLRSRSALTIARPN